MDSLDVVVFLLIGICGITDIQTGKIFNKVTYPAILVGIVWNLLVPNAPGWESSLAGFGLAFVLMGSVTLLGGMGGGDFKLFVAIGALRGYPFILDVLFYSFLLGGTYALIVAIWQGRLYRTLRRVGRRLFGIFIARVSPEEELKEGPSDKIPFGVAICLGTLWAQLAGLFAQ